VLQCFTLANNKFITCAQVILGKHPSFLIVSVRLCVCLLRVNVKNYILNDDKLMIYVMMPSTSGYISMTFDIDARS